MRRKKDIIPNEWILDSGAFSRITLHGFHWPIEQYSEAIKRWSRCGKMVAAVAQDWMCEPHVIQKTGLSVPEHQDLTVDNYAKLIELTNDTYIMPVLQGYTPSEYRRCITKYGKLLKHGQWIGVGSVCKRNANTGAIMEVLLAIKSMRPDLRLHGFGLKLTALTDPRIRGMLYSSDSMAWSFAARRSGGDQNGLHEATEYANRIENIILATPAQSFVHRSNIFERVRYNDQP